ncbi:MAG: hypothetical protein NT013_23470 [Planctomycetia bacterium]|nr:hypothetical protein [Planctomycetia bacterium]
MTWDAVAELSSLQERFRKPTVARNWELLDAVWTNFRRARFSEGGLWLPSKPKPGELIQGRVFLSDATLGTPAFIKEKQTCYSTATKAAANEFRRLAILGGDIVSRIPRLEAELRPFVDGGGIGLEPDHERWWLGLLFREVASEVVEKDYGVEAVKLGQGLTAEVEIKGLYRASEAACEKLLQFLAGPLHQQTAPRDSGIVAAKTPLSPDATEAEEMLFGWADILDAVRRPINDSEQRRIRRLNKIFKGPIITDGQPRAVKSKLLEWLKVLASRKTEIDDANDDEQVRECDAVKSANIQTPFGMSGIVAHEIGGSVKSRRGEKSQSKPDKR